VKSRKSKNDRFGRIIFIAPIIIIVGFVVYGYFQATAPGTLVVHAIAQDKYEPLPNSSTMLQVNVEVGQAIVTTPTSLSEPPGTYDVTYGPLQWYTTPASTTVTIANRLTVYASGAYEVVPRFIKVTAAGGFNDTFITAEHQVTPVIWINPSDTFVAFTIAGLGSETIQAGQNVTIVFQNPGNFDYTLSSGSSASSSGVVQVQ
jgi:hypothetical protein